jgi:uncharacterized membrane protein
MTLLIAGVLLWALVHFIPSLAQPLKQSMVSKMGENGYKGIFTLLMFAALALIIFGWRSIEQPAYVYHLPVWTRHLGMLLVLLGFLLMGASNYNTRIKQFVRHPQLTGVAVWAIAHLIMNGDNRSLVLFGGLGIWAVLEIVFINRREGAWEKPDIPAWSQEVKGLVISLVVFAVFVFAHPWIAGVPIR